MLHLIFWRLAQLPVLLVVIFLATFALAWVLPGSPLDEPDRLPPPAIRDAMLRQYNLDSPWSFVRGYVAGLARGDLGPSLQYEDQRVSDIIARGLPVSAALGAAALAFALLLGTAAGVLGALRPNSLLDASSLAATLVGVSLPAFVTGSVLLALFAGLLRWFPVGGWGTPAHFVLPAITLGVLPAAYVARLVRLGLADVMSSDFIRTARAKGLSQNAALFRHALKVAYLPVLSYLGPAAATAMTGSFVVEKVFTIPGLGEHFVKAVITKDQFLILGVVLVYSTILIAFNLAVDVAYAWLDPRIEL